MPGAVPLSFAPRKSRRPLGSRENAEPRIRRGGGGRGRSRRGRAGRCRGRWQHCRERSCRAERDSDSGRRMGRCGSPRRGQSLPRLPAPPNRRGAAGSVHGFGHCIKSDLSCCCQCTRLNRTEGGREHRSSILCQRPPASHPRGPLHPSPLRAMAVPGAPPSSARWERGGGGWRGKCCEIRGGKGKGNSSPGLQCLGHLLLLLYCCYPASHNNSQTRAFTVIL